ncbi:MAG: tandem-95 repeat protein [Chloroflexi bacterium]|nr:tandem-95 repeat protein [Chloroflexota bacterium]
MSGKKAVFRFVLALSLAVVGLVVLFGLLGATQEQVLAAAPRPAIDLVDRWDAPRMSPPINSVRSPMDAPPAAPLYNGISAASVITVCKPSAGPCDYATVQNAVDAAATGDIVKVAQGVYNDVQFPNVVVYIYKTLSLRGGYTTTGVAAWMISDPDKYPTVLDGENSNRVMIIANDVIAPIIEGFHIRNGVADFGAGMYIIGGSPQIRRNRIYRNAATDSGGGIYIAASGNSPVVENNFIYTNTADSRGGGIYAGGDSPFIHYNTFVDNLATNQGGGLYLISDSPVVSASIVVSNVAGAVDGGGGIFNAMPTFGGSVKYNDVISNVQGDFVGFDLPRPLNNLGELPLFVNLSAWNLRLQPGSPCIGRNNPDYYPSTRYPADDYDSLARSFGPYPDIGASEYYTGTCFARVDSSRVYTTVQEAVDAFSAANDEEVKVAGSCTGSGSNVVYLDESLTLRGGYTLTNWSVPYADTYATVLDGEGARRVIQVDAMAATVEGFHIYNGYTSDRGGGIYIEGGVDQVSLIRNNWIHSNTVDGGGGGIFIGGGSPTIQGNEIYHNAAPDSWGGGIYIDNSAALIQDNTIYTNTSKSGGGMYVLGTQAIVEYNRIYENSAVAGDGTDQGGGGIYAFGDVLVRRNVISGNVTYDLPAAFQDVRGGGMYARAASVGTTDRVTVEQNLIYGNAVVHSGSPEAQGGGVYVFDRMVAGQSLVLVQNNVVYSNTSDQEGGGIGVRGNAVIDANTVYGNQSNNNQGGGIARYNGGGGAGDPIVRNNIVISNTGYGIHSLEPARITVDYNDLLGNTLADCFNVDCNPGTSTNLNADPQFEDLGGFDFRLQAGSLCIDAVTVITHPVYDYDNYARPFGQYADMGAHEYYTGDCFARLSTGGGVYTSVQAAVDVAVAGVDDVRVAGVCQGNDGMATIDKSLSLSGGYTKSNWIEPTYPTILDAQNGGRVLTISGAGATPVTIERLIVMDGSTAGDGGGIYVDWPLSPTIQNVIFYDNGAVNGGGFASSGGNPYLYNNTFVANTAATDGGGLYLNGGAPVLGNNIVVSNTRGGIHIAGGSLPILAYNNVRSNTVGDYGGGLSAGATDISEPPYFVAPAGPVFRLRFDSPCIHAGDPGTGVALDFEGHARPDGSGQGQRYDIGADEAIDYLGVSLGPDVSGLVAASGDTVEYTHYLTNTGTRDDEFSITHTVEVSGGDSAGWQDQVTYISDYTLSADESSPVMVSVQVPGGVSSGTQATIFMTATYQSGSDYFFDVTTSTIVVIDSADLMLVKSITPDTAAPGDAITYTISFSNVGAELATGVVISDNVPLSVTNTSVISSGNALSPMLVITRRVSTRYVWDVDNLAPGAGGVITVTGTLSDVLAAGVFTNTATIATTAVDGDADNNSDDAGVEVQNVAPVADDDAFNVDEDSSLNPLDVLDGDTDANGDTLTITTVGNPDSGGAVVNGGTVVTYTPLAGYVGDEVFTYTVSDGNDGFDTATVTVTVDNVNDNPTATDDSATVNEDSGANTIDVLDNDSYLPDPVETLTISAVGQGADGSVAITNGGADLSYTPDADFYGTDTFTYTIGDSHGGTDTATVTVTVDNVNDRPIAVDDMFTVDEDSTDNPLDVLLNDFDRDGDTLTISAVGPVYSGGGTAVNGGTVITYTPMADFYGYETFTYTISDGNGGFDTSTVNVTVNQGPVDNNPPVAVDDAAVAEWETPVTVAVLDNDSDPDSDPITVTAVGAATNGTTAYSNSVVTYTSDAGFTGTDTFTYTISDGEDSDTALVTVNVAQARFVIDADDPTDVILDLPGGCRTDIQASIGTVPVDMDMLYNVASAPSITPPNHEFVGCAFTLDAYLGGMRQDDFDFDTPISVTLTYEEANVAGLNLDTMQLFAKDDGSDEWSTDGITRESLDPVARRHTSRVAHLTQFGLFVQQEPALRVFKSVNTGGLDPVPLGSVVTYTLVISNSTDEVANNVVLTDPLPSAVTFGDWVMYGGSALLPPPGTVNLPPVTIEWSPGDVATGAAYTLSFTAHVVTDTQFAGDTVVNTAYVIADNADLDSDSVSFGIKGGESYIYLPLVVRNAES